MKQLILAALLGSTLLTGCLPRLDIGPPVVLSKSELRNRDFGRYPSNYQQIIKQHLAQTLRDPESARIGRFVPPRKYLYIYRLDWEDKQVRYDVSYFACVYVNAKNGYGGYTGWQEHVYFIRNGQIVIGDSLHVRCDSEEDFIIFTNPKANAEIVP